MENKSTTDKVDITTFGMSYFFGVVHSLILTAGIFWNTNTYFGIKPKVHPSNLSKIEYVQDSIPTLIYQNEDVYIKTPENTFVLREDYIDSQIKKRTEELKKDARKEKKTSIKNSNIQARNIRDSIDSRVDEMIKQKRDSLEMIYKTEHEKKY